MTIYGYARCSTNETRQNIDKQVRDLKAMGADNQSIFLEYESCTNLNRVELNRLLKIITKGDSVVCTEVSIITRSTKQLCEIIDLAKENNISLVLENFVVDCSKELDPMTEGMIKMVGVFSELERNMISRRVKSGVANARAKGKIVGRPQLKLEDIPRKVMDNLEHYNNGILNKVDYAKVCGISRPTLDKYLTIIN